MVDQELLEAISAVLDQKLAPIYGRMDKLDSRMDKLDSRMDKLDSRMDKLEKEVLEIKVTQEGVVLPRIQMLAEGHENILEHIQEKIDAKTDKLQDQVDVLTIAVKYHSKEIQELKKAQ